MAVNFITTGSEASPPKVTGNESNLYLESRTRSLSGGVAQQTDTWRGPIAAVREAYNLFSGAGGLSSISEGQNGGSGTLTVTWDAQFGGEQPPDEQAGDVWSASFLEVPTPLAAHPYFQVPYFPGSGELIEDELARVESAVKRGQPYTAEGVYADYAKRYYGLRMAGVEEWTQYGVEISRRFSTDQQANAVGVFGGTGKYTATANIGMPAELKALVDAVERISGYASSDPDSAIFTPATFEFIQRPPDVVLNTDADNNTRFDMTVTWWGLSQWSKVIYPNASWDPPTQGGF